MTVLKGQRRVPKLTQILENIFVDAVFGTETAHFAVALITILAANLLIFAILFHKWCVLRYVVRIECTLTANPIDKLPYKCLISVLIHII